MMNVLERVLFTLAGGLLALNAACGPAALPTPTPLPTPNPITADLTCYSGRNEGKPRKINLNYQNPVQCFIDNKLVLKFEALQELVIGNTLTIPVFVSREVYSRSSVPVKYSKQRCIDTDIGLGPCPNTENTEMITLAEVPVDREVTLKFKPDGVGDYNFFLPGINFLEPENRWPGKRTYSSWHSENRGVIGRVEVGRSSSINARSDAQEVAPYTAIVISGSTSPPTCSMRANITKDGAKVDSIDVESRTGKYSINWLPKETGTYKITVTSYYPFDCVRDYILSSTSDPLTIVVK